MSADILGTSWDQCRSIVQYSFTSTETRRLVRTDSPGRPPRLSHSFWTMNRPNSKHWFIYIYLGGRCRKPMLGVWGPSPRRSVLCGSVRLSVPVGKRPAAGSATCASKDVYCRNCHFPSRQNTWRCKLQLEDGCSDYHLQGLFVSSSSKASR